MLSSTMPPSTDLLMVPLCSLPLQILLHLHAHLLPFFILAQIGCFVLKFPALYSTYRNILIALHFVSVLTHIARPLLGYHGNLKEQISALSGFWTLTALLHLPIILFLGLNPDLHPLPLELFVYIMDCTFSSIELILAAFLIKRLANRQMELFRIAMQRNDFEPKNDSRQQDTSKG